MYTVDHGYVGRHGSLARYLQGLWGGVLGGLRLIGLGSCYQLIHLLIIMCQSGSVLADAYRYGTYPTVQYSPYSTYKVGTYRPIPPPDYGADTIYVHPSILCLNLFPD